MNSKKILFFFLVGYLVLGCNNYRQPNYINISDKIIAKYLRDMKNQYGLICFGSGGGFLKQVNEIMLSFDLVGQKNKEELRNILVTINEELLDRYNQNKEIRPYLKNYPFKAENIRIAIVLVDEQGNTLSNKGSGKELFYGICQSWGRIIFRIKNEEKLYVQDIYEEPYEKALKIIQAQKPDLFPKQ